MRKLRTDFGRGEAPHSSVFSLSCEKNERNWLKPKREKSKTVREEPSASIHRLSQQLNISETSLRRIWYKDHGITPYKVQLVQDLKPIDHLMSFRFAKLFAGCHHR